MSGHAQPRHSQRRSVTNRGDITLHLLVRLARNVFRYGQQRIDTVDPFLNDIVKDIISSVCLQTIAVGSRIKSLSSYSFFIFWTQSDTVRASRGHINDSLWCRCGIPLKSRARRQWQSCQIKNITHQKKNSRGRGRQSDTCIKRESALGSGQRACLMKSYRRSYAERASVIRLPCLHGETSRDSLNRRRAKWNRALLLCILASFGFWHRCNTLTLVPKVQAED